MRYCLNPGTYVPALTGEDDDLLTEAVLDIQLTEKKKAQGGKHYTACALNSPDERRPWKGESDDPQFAVYLCVLSSLARPAEQKEAPCG